MESRCRELLLEKHCKKLLYLMDCFWEATVDVDVDISCLVKVRNHLDKIEKEHAKTKRKKASLFHLKRMVLERFDEHLSHFQFKTDFLSHYNFLCPEFENLYTCYDK